MTFERFLTPPQIAKMLRISELAVARAIRTGELAASNFSSGTRPRWKVSPEAFRDWVASRSNAAAAKRKRAKVSPMVCREYV
jgi:hypothetical protein